MQRYHEVIAQKDVKGRLAASILVVLSTLLLPVYGEEVITSPGDARQYAHTRLANGLKVLMISDPETTKAAAALDIAVGASSNPDERPGLAHFVEHALYLGTQRYPEPGEYEKYINAHGGRENAYTAFDHTNFYFTIDASNLHAALDRFSQLFAAPRFDPAYMQRERIVVDAEYKSKLRDDARRLRYAQKQLFNPRHPFSRFSTGNRETLADRDSGSFRDELIAFYEAHYSANLMTLVVLGQEPIATLKDWAESMFSSIPDRNVERTRIDEPLFEPGKLPVRIDVTPVKNLRFLVMTFPIPSLVPHFHSKPARFIESVLNHEGNGHLLQQLRERRWGNGLRVESNPTRKDATTFNISVSLTRLGLTRVDDVVDLVFDYIALIRDKGIAKWRFEELAQIAASDFRFMRNSSVDKYVKRLAHRLQLYPAADVVRAPYLFGRFEPDVIRHYLDFLTPENMLLTVVSKKSNTNAEAPWYGTPYAAAPIKGLKVRRWRNIAGTTALALPKPNAFVATKLDLKPLDAVTADPELVIERDGFSAWYRQDDTFRTPRADFFFSVNSELATQSPRHALLARLYVSLVNQQLSAYTYPARLAGLSVKIQSHTGGFSVYLSGYHEKQSLLLTRVLDVLKTPVITEAAFSLRKESLRRSLTSFRQERPYKQTVMEIRRLLLDPYWTEDELQSAIEPLTRADLVAFIPKLLASGSVKALSHGNLHRAESLRAFNLLERTFVEGSHPAKILHRNLIRLENGSDYVRELSIEHPDAAIAVYYQGANRDDVSKAEFALLAQVLKPHFYRELRTNRKLGYHVFTNYLELVETPGVAFIVQAPEASSHELQIHVDEFVSQYAPVVAQMSDEDFETHRKALLNRIFEHDAHLRARSGRYWRELFQGHSDFGKRERFANAVRALTKDGFVKAYHRILLSQGRNRLVVRSASPEQIEGEAQTPASTLIPSADFFRKTQARIPVPVAGSSVSG